jgi:hypothetical protein
MGITKKNVVIILVVIYSLLVINNPIAVIASMYKIIAFKSFLVNFNHLIRNSRLNLHFL